LNVLEQNHWSNFKNCTDSGPWSAKTRVNEINWHETTCVPSVEGGYIHKGG